jgi:hypothetical protein
MGLIFNKIVQLSMRLAESVTPLVIRILCPARSRINPALLPLTAWVGHGLVARLLVLASAAPVNIDFPSGCSETEAPIPAATIRRREKLEKVQILFENFEIRLGC